MIMNSDFFYKILYLIYIVDSISTKISYPIKILYIIFFLMQYKIMFLIPSNFIMKIYKVLILFIIIIYN